MPCYLIQYTKSLPFSPDGYNIQVQAPNLAYWSTIITKVSDRVSVKLEYFSEKETNYIEASRSGGYVPPGLTFKNYKF
jgi:hypothetical protein